MFDSLAFFEWLQRARDLLYVKWINAPARRGEKQMPSVCFGRPGNFWGHRIAMLHNTSRLIFETTAGSKLYPFALGGSCLSGRESAGRVMSRALCHVRS